MSSLQGITFVLGAVATLSLSGFAAGSAAGETPVKTALRGAPGPALAEAAFLDELEGMTGAGSRRATELRLQDFQAALKPTFVALPKTAGGGVSASAARYAIHRFFIQLRGWYIRGLSPVGSSWEPSVPALGMAGHLPERVKDFFEYRFGSDDFDLKELALITATVEALVHGEAIERLHASYKAFGLNPEESLSMEDAVETVYACMTKDYNISQFAQAQVESTRRSVELAQEEVAPGKTAFSFMDVAKVMKSATEQIGHRVDEGFCQAMDNRLTHMQDGPNSGRVQLADFYNYHLDHKSEDFQPFHQRPEYLRRVGALDESDPTAPRIIIPNYLLMQGNCLNVSSYYDFCCIDLCEDLLDALGRAIQAPQASPAEILSVLTRRGSASVPAGRNFSQALVKKLEEVAAHHGGTVPVHGRLFSQWMHFAYPTECAYPHISGATKPLTYSEWFEEMGTHAMVTEAEMQSIINSTGSVKSSGAGPCDSSEEGLCMWVQEEELVDAVNWQRVAKSPARSSSSSLPLAQPGHQEGHMTSAVRALAIIVVIVSSIMVLAEQARAAFKQAYGQDELLAKGN